MYVFFIQKTRTFLLPPARPPVPFLKANLMRTKQLIDCSLKNQAAGQRGGWNELGVKLQTKSVKHKAWWKL